MGIRLKVPISESQVHSTDTMKPAIALIFVAILAVDCFPKKPGGRKANKGARKPCGGEDNLEECECQDGAVYDNKEDLKENCGKHSDNKIVSCTCTDGETWTPPEKGGKHGGGRGKGKRGKKPCGGEENLEECECKDGSTYDNKEDLKENCPRHSDNDIVSCTCTDGEDWSPPAKGGKHGRGRGKGRGKGKKGKPCGPPDNIEECECKDGSTYNDIEDLKENCPKGSTNDIVSCTCKDGESWSPSVKDGKHGRGGGKGKERPCIEKGNVQNCTCDDGETYGSKQDLKENCKDDNPISSCECKDGSTWEPTEDEEEEEEEYDEGEEEEEEDYEDEEEDDEDFSEFK